MAGQEVVTGTVTTSASVQRPRCLKINNLRYKEVAARDCGWAASLCQPPPAPRVMLRGRDPLPAAEGGRGAELVWVVGYEGTS